VSTKHFANSPTTNSLIQIPGYGRSSPSKAGTSKRAVGNAILEALRGLLGSDQKQAIIIGGHNRGARICHRLAVDGINGQLGNWLIRGAILDIVPTLVQWQSLADCKNAAADFHLPFLANSSVATKMIKQYGGDNWCRERILEGAGQNPEGLQSLKRDGAVDLYSKYYEKESVIRASCEDIDLEHMKMSTSRRETGMQTSNLRLIL
jgi:hypothetical protein